jgi:hypothetical protein
MENRNSKKLRAFFLGVARSFDLFGNLHSEAYTQALSQKSFEPNDQKALAGDLKTIRGDFKGVFENYIANDLPSKMKHERK